MIPDTKEERAELEDAIAREFAGAWYGVHPSKAWATVTHEPARAKIREAAAKVLRLVAHFEPGKLSETVGASSRRTEYVDTDDVESIFARGNRNEKPSTHQGAAGDTRDDQGSGSEWDIPV